MHPRSILRTPSSQRTSWCMSDVGLLLSPKTSWCLSDVGRIAAHVRRSMFACALAAPVLFAAIEDVPTIAIRQQFVLVLRTILIDPGNWELNDPGNWESPPADEVVRVDPGFVDEADSSLVFTLVLNANGNIDFHGFFPTIYEVRATDSFEIFQLDWLHQLLVRRPYSSCLPTSFVGLTGLSIRGLPPDCESLALPVAGLQRLARSRFVAFTRCGPQARTAKMILPRSSSGAGK
jgi:hypothetical protein